MPLNPLPWQRRWAALESVSTGALSSAPTQRLYQGRRSDLSEFVKVQSRTANVKIFRKENYTLNQPVFLSKES